MSVESVTQAVSNLALEFGDDDAREGAMVRLFPQTTLLSSALSKTSKMSFFNRVVHLELLCYLEEWMLKDPNCKNKKLYDVL